MRAQSHTEDAAAQPARRAHEPAVRRSVGLSLGPRPARPCRGHDSDRVGSPEVAPVHRPKRATARPPRRSSGGGDGENKAAAATRAGLQRQEVARRPWALSSLAGDSPSPHARWYLCMHLPRPSRDTAAKPGASPGAAAGRKCSTTSRGQREASCSGVHAHAEGRAFPPRACPPSPGQATTEEGDRPGHEQEAQALGCVSTQQNQAGAARVAWRSAHLSCALKAPAAQRTSAGASTATAGPYTPAGADDSRTRGGGCSPQMAPDREQRQASQQPLLKNSERAREVPARARSTKRKIQEAKATRRGLERERISRGCQAWRGAAPWPHGA